MSVQFGKLCSIVLEQYFGKTVQRVGDCLFASIQSRTLSMIIKSTGLKRAEVTYALAILLKFRLAKYETNNKFNLIEYSLHKDRIPLILRYPRYVHLIQTKFGQSAASLTEELLRSGTQTASKLIVQCTNNSDDNTKAKELQATRDAFYELVKTHYFIRGPLICRDDPITISSPITSNSIPKLYLDERNSFKPPTIDLDELLKLKNGVTIPTTDEEIYWIINEEKFHTDFRDAVMISGMERKINFSAGECIKYILQLMYTKSDAWHPQSNPISFFEIKQLVERSSTNPDLKQYLEEYMSVIIDDQLTFLGKDGDSGGGQYVVQMKKAVEQLTWACVESIVMEKFGSKAVRIFRVVRFHKYTEQIRIQKEAMIQAKDAKLITYKLLDEHFLQFKPIRKAGGGGAGMAKSFYLFYVDQSQLVTMLIETCYKALFNSLTRAAHNKVENKRLIDKAQRIESIVETMKERGDSEEYITEIMDTLTPPEREILEKVKIRIKNLYSAEVGLDETLFLLQLFDMYKNMK